MDKYFMHRIKEENGTFTTGIEVHDSKDSAVRSFHGYMKQGYGNPTFPNITFVACFVEGPRGEILPEYDAFWQKPGTDVENKIFFTIPARKTGSSAKLSMSTVLWTRQSIASMLRWSMGTTIQTMPR